MRKNIVFRLLLGLLWGVPGLVLGQIQVSFPLPRMVLQRSTGNTATVHITGYYTVPLSRVEARLVSRDGSGAGIDWTPIQANPQGGVYGGDLSARAGWYNLEVRGISNDQPVGNTTVVERVGVGEVFVVSGQSNAQGVNRYETGRGVTPPSANSDRVSCVNLYTESQGDPPLPAFSHLDGGSNLAPGGFNGWCWGALGDLLTQRLGVPVLFLNAAWGATSVQNWEESYTNGTTNNQYTGVPYPAGQPYANLRTALRAYTHLLGVRAVLWHQGEADNRLNMLVPGNYPGSEYTRRLAALINQSRQDTGKPLNWMVARVSYDDVYKSNNTILNAQNAVIANTGNVFAGPNTDVIQIPRDRGAGDGVHFDAAGMVEAANAWNASLTDNFFNVAQPQLPAAMPAVAVACADNNQLRLSLGGYASAGWSSGQNGGSIVAGGGQYQARVKDNLGNTNFSPVFNVSAAPAIGGGSVVCEGSTLTLTANYDNVIWNTNVQARSITIGTGGTYFARYNDVSGCQFTSNSVGVTVNKLPPAPTVTAQKPTVFCQGDNTILASTGAARYNWSNGSQGQQADIRTAGTYFLTITDGNGCTSPVSNNISVTVNPVPARPSITASGPLTFCADQQVTLTAPDATAFVWSSGQTSRSITTNQAGQYSVRVLNTFNCSSETSVGVGLTVNPLPPAPTLQAQGPTVFCDGGQVTLRVSTALKPIWTTGETTASVTASRSGNYSARVQDGNGCFSPLAAPIVVDAKPNPQPPVVRQVGTYILQAGDLGTNTTYRWTLERDSLRVTTPSVKVVKDGNYAALAFIRYPGGLTCASQVSAPYLYTLPRDNGDLSVYPNPSPDKNVSVETLPIVDNASIFVYTLLGQRVFKAYTEQLAGPLRLNLLNLPPGEYLLQVEGDGFKGIKRVLVGID